MLPDVTAPATYGLPKIDYDTVVDPTKEIAAAEYEALAVDVSGMSYVLPKAWVSIVGTTPPTVAAHGAVWGNTEAVKPTVSRTSEGLFVVTWAASYYDLNPTTARRVLRNVNILWVIACVNAKKTTAYPIQAVRTSACSATITIGTGASLDDSNFTVLVG